MLEYVLDCSVCKGTFNTIKKWLTHLLEPNHQSKARKEIYQWGDLERECALVAFSSSHVASLELLQYFSMMLNTIVTDFVWFDTLGRVGFIQLESSVKVDEIMSSCEGSEIRIQNQQVAIKKAGECLSLEWISLLPLPTPVAADDFLENSNNKKPKKGRNATATVVSASIHKASGTGKTTSQVKPAKRSRIPSDSDEFQARAEPDPPQSLSTQYDLICQEIEITDEDYKTAETFLETVYSHAVKIFPSCQLVWFRNYYLKLKSTSSSDLTFFIDQKGLYGKHEADTEASSYDFPAISNETIDQLLFTIPDLRIRSALKQGNGNQGGRRFICRSNKFKFTLVSIPFVMLPEIQACRLVEYFCSCDPRVKPLLTVIRYWAKTNEIRLDNPNETSCKRAQEPAVLDWMVIFFLCHKTKMLPTPREITEGSHPKLRYFTVNIGITTDPSIARINWKRYKKPNGEQHVLNVFNLTNKFFKFYSKDLGLDKGKRVALNTMDGEVIPMDNFVGKPIDLPSKLAVSERKLGREEILEGKFESDSLHLLHPLYLRHGFSFCNDNFMSRVLPAMRTTREQLEQALKLHKGGQELDIKSVLLVNE
ncbi:unnamed protein product [Orchesella dallaii]|uniref:C2H2-type domain-containing protein n=1 Tax=Orchesella dallaii TaxID=48710 RepID=A0ABP1Q282_9HEXA